MYKGQKAHFLVQMTGDCLDSIMRYKYSNILHFQGKWKKIDQTLVISLAFTSIRRRIFIKALRHKQTLLKFLHAKAAIHMEFEFLGAHIIFSLTWA